MAVSHFLWQALVLLMLVLSTMSTPLNSTTLPPTVSNHGDPHLLCLPAKWTDIIVFYLGNYVAHAATTKTEPGQNRYIIIFVVVGALLFPVSGLYRGLYAIFSFAIFGKTDLQIATRAGALVMIVAEQQEPSDEGKHPTNTHDLTTTDQTGTSAQPLPDEKRGLSEP
jgi:hypothetical protein